MDQIEFRHVPAAHAAPGSSVIVPFVNGLSLVELARQAEAASAARDGQPDLAGTYGGLWPDGPVLWPSKHYLGEPRLSHSSNLGDTVLLGCDCGEWGCWPLSAQVTVEDQHVIWNHFTHGFRTHWDYSALGPFTFDREQYEQAVRSTADRA